MKWFSESETSSDGSCYGIHLEGGKRIRDELAWADHLHADMASCGATRSLSHLVFRNTQIPSTPLNNIP